eukprot:Clim_evm67s150 gene=Clim_evmTU67s150
MKRLRKALGGGGNAAVAPSKLGAAERLSTEVSMRPSLQDTVLLEKNLLAKAEDKETGQLQCYTLIQAAQNTLMDMEIVPTAVIELVDMVYRHPEAYIQVIVTSVRELRSYDGTAEVIIEMIIAQLAIPTQQTLQRLVRILHNIFMAPRAVVYEKRNVLIVWLFLLWSLRSERLQSIDLNPLVDIVMQSLALGTEPILQLFSSLVLEAMLQRNVHFVYANQVSFAEYLYTVVSLYRQNEGLLTCLEREVLFVCSWMLDGVLPHRFWRPQPRPQGPNRHIRMLPLHPQTTVKMSPDGAEIRNDGHTYEVLRLTAGAKTGKWFFEITILTKGIVKIGFVQESAPIMQGQQEEDLGMDEFSWAYDGHRQLLHHGDTSSVYTTCPWQAGVVVGTYIDMEAKHMIFTVDGHTIGKCFTDCVDFQNNTDTLCPAISLGRFQHVLVNFGTTEFQYPPHSFDVFAAAPSTGQNQNLDRSRSNSNSNNIIYVPPSQMLHINDGQHHGDYGHSTPLAGAGYTPDRTSLIQWH